MRISRSELPPPRLYKLTHPRLIKIRDGFRRVIQLAVKDRWRALKDEKSALRKGGLDPEDKEEYFRLNDECNYLKACYFHSIIHTGQKFIGGPDTDISGDRVRVFLCGEYRNSDNLLVEKKFYSPIGFKNSKEWYMGNFRHYAPIYKELYENHPEKLFSYEEFHFQKDKFFNKR